MSHPTLFFYPRPRVDIAEVPALSHAGAVLLTDTIHATGLAPSLREALAPWTKPLAEHHAAKVLGGVNSSKQHRLRGGLRIFLLGCRSQGMLGGGR